MNDDRKNRLQELFLELAEIEPSEREKWFEKNQIEPEVRVELLDLLKFHDETRLPIDQGIFSIELDTRTEDFQIRDDMLSPSLKIAGYELKQEIARGGQSIVFDAIQLSTSQRVAVKVLISADVSSDQERARQDREVKILASLQHPYIVGVIDRGKTASGIDYVVMPFIEGRCLDEHVLYMEQESLSSTDSNMLRLFVKIAKAVGFAHDQRIVHRDLKPGNILVDRHGEPRILDFGLAKVFDSVGSSHGLDRPNSLTIDGAFMGSLPWASPEQAGGELNKISSRTDVYALGVILYQMLTGGAFPYSVVGNIMDVLDNILHSDPVPPSERGSKKTEKTKANSRDAAQPQIRLQLLNPAMDAIVLKSLSKNPEDRYLDGSEFASDIERYLEGKNTHALAEPVVDRHQSKGQGIRIKFASVIAAFFLVLIIAVVIIYGNRNGNGRNENTARVNQTLENPSANIRALNETRDDIVESDDWPLDAPPPAIAPFEADLAKAHQEAWAKYLGVPIEYENSIGMNFRLIPPGKFKMGSSSDEIQSALKITGQNFRWRARIMSEAPQHDVVLTQPFFLASTEVTQTQFEQVMGKNPSFFAKNGRIKRWVDKVENEDTSNLPVEGVTRSEIREFCTRLDSQEQSKLSQNEKATTTDETGYRLPTEAEWEFACRAGTTTRFGNGDQVENLTDVGWLISNSDRRPHPVRDLQANAFGLFDMHGNVWECVQDAWNPSYYGLIAAHSPAVNPVCTTGEGSLRIVRGGGFQDNPLSCRSTDRDAIAMNNRNPQTGLRVAVSVDAVRKWSSPSRTKAEESPKK